VTNLLLIGPARGRDDEKEHAMDDQQSNQPEHDERGSALARWGRPGAFAAAGLVAGGLLAGSLSASADDSSTATTGDYAATAPSQGTTGNGDPSQPQRPDEKLLTGTTADKVEAAALAKYPGATVVRIETDSDGIYEAHLTTAAGQPVTVEVNKSFAVTGTEQGGAGGHGGPGQTSGESGTSSSGYGV
jgi:hypothetical protein